MKTSKIGMYSSQRKYFTMTILQETSSSRSKPQDAFMDTNIKLDHLTGKLLKDPFPHYLIQIFSYV